MPAIKDSAAQNAALYEADFAEWAERTAELLKSRRFDDVDITALVEEIESLAGAQKREAQSRLTVTITHLLKWRYQPERRSASWESTIVVQRLEMTHLLDASPSMKNHARKSFDRAYRDGRRIALIETGLNKTAIPETPVFTLKQVLDEDFLP